MTHISWYIVFFALKNILVLFAKCNSGELRCNSGELRYPVTALIAPTEDRTHNLSHAKPTLPLCYKSWLGSVTNYTVNLLIIPPAFMPRGIVFVFQFVHSSVHNFVPFVELLQSFTLKQLEWSVSHQPLIRKHSYLDNRYPGGLAFIPWLLTPGSVTQGGARRQNLGHL